MQTYAHASSCFIHRSFTRGLSRLASAPVSTSVTSRRAYGSLLTCLLMLSSAALCFKASEPMRDHRS